VWPEHADQPFGQFRQVVVNLFAQPSHRESKAFKQAFDIRIGCTGFIQIEHRCPIGMGLRELFCGFTQVAHFRVKITQGQIFHCVFFCCPMIKRRN
jgi:hypothetical protein